MPAPPNEVYTVSSFIGFVLCAFHSTGTLKASGFILTIGVGYPLNDCTA